MSPARLDYFPTPEGSLCGSLPLKALKPRKEETDIDLVDDIKTLWETRWKSAVSCPHY